MIICQDNEITSENDDSYNQTTSKQKDSLLNVYIEIKGEAISLCDVFRKLNIQTHEIEYIFEYNPNVSINFSGTLNDLLTHLHKVNNIHTNIQYTNNVTIMCFKECEISKQYSLDGVNININSIVDNICKIVNDKQNVLQIGSRILQIKTSCKTHAIIEKFIQELNYVNNISIDLELTTIDIYTTNGFDNNYMELIRATLNSTNNTNQPNVTQITNHLSTWLNKNGNGQCKLTSNTFCTLYNNSSVEINTGINDTEEKLVPKHMNKINYDNQKSYMKLNIKAECHSTEYGYFTFTINNKSQLGNLTSSVNDSIIPAQIANGKIFYLLDRDGGGVTSQESLMSSKDQQYKIRTVVLVQVKIKKGEQNAKKN